MATRAEKVSSLLIVARTIGEGFDCFVFGLVLLAFGGCSPHVGSRQRRAGQKRWAGDHLPPICEELHLPNPIARQPLLQSASSKAKSAIALMAGIAYNGRAPQGDMRRRYFMIFENLFRKGNATAGGKFVVVRAGKAMRSDNPLPSLFPALYAQTPRDSFAQRDALETDARRIAGAFIQACRLPPDINAKLAAENFALIFDIPPVYELLLSLKRQGFERFYANNFAVGTLLQLAAFYGLSEMAESLRVDLMLCLLAVFFRYFGLNFLPKNEREILASQRQYDLSNSHQRQLREDFLEQYRHVADRLAHVSSERFLAFAKDKARCPAEKMLAISHIIRFSSRLMGRAAADLKDKELEKVHSLASYVAEIYSIASAWVSLRKRLCLILAEEWARSRVYAKQKDIQVSARYNLHALSDVFRICRCELLCNFQGSGHDAVYSVAENIVVKAIPMPLPANHDATVSSPMRRFACFQPPRQLSYRARMLSECLLDTHRAGGDPSDAELKPLD